jgi:PleD family two-component response regulator
VVAEELGVDTTLSIGIVSSESCARESMLAEADEALYRSKAAGGNTAETMACAQS